MQQAVYAQTISFWIPAFAGMTEWVFWIAGPVLDPGSGSVLESDPGQAPTPDPPE